MTTVAVIQPYFVPYAGYFRLFAAADVVVMFDCVQFPRRGWVHRNQLATASGKPDWLTLPIEKAPRDARIADLRFPPDAADRLAAEMRRFPALEAARKRGDPVLERVLALGGVDVAAYLCELVGEFSRRLGFERPMRRSSELDIAPELRAQDRVLAVVRALGGTRYVNPSGGRELYDHGSFAAAGVELRFLTPYGGAAESILARVLADPIDAIAAEIARETALVE